MFEPFQSAALLIKRANFHLQEFEKLNQTFINSKPARIITETEKATGCQLVKVAFIADLPEDLPVVAFDLINCLRSALDHAVYDSAVVLGASPKPKGTKFPFARKSDDGGIDFIRKQSEVPESIQKFCLAFEPYEGGSHRLWELNELRNQKIHRILEAVYIKNESIGFGNGTVTNMIFDAVNEWNPGKKHLTIMRIQPGSCMNIQLRPTIQVAFSEGGVFSGQRAQKVLSNAATTVKGVAEAIARETAKIKAADG